MEDGDASRNMETMVRVMDTRLTSQSRLDSTKNDSDHHDYDTVIARSSSLAQQSTAANDSKSYCEGSAHNQWNHRENQTENTADYFGSLDYNFNERENYGRFTFPSKK